MDNMKKFHWNEDTLKFFRKLKNNNENEFYRKVNEFVKYECELEEGEYIEDLLTDLIIQVIEYKL